MHQILDWHAPNRGDFTLFRVHEGAVVGTVCFTVRVGGVHIEFLARNDHFSMRGISVGGVLLRAVEGFAEHYGCDSITLDAIDDEGLLEWYLSRGFMRRGEPYFDPE